MYIPAQVMRQYFFSLVSDIQLVIPSLSPYRNGSVGILYTLKGTVQLIQNQKGQMKEKLNLARTAL